MEIEETLRTHKKVRDVCVVAIHHDVWGETICAILSPEDSVFDLDELMLWMKTNMISYKRPRKIKLMDDFPRNRLGKVIKSEVRGLFEKETENLDDDT